MKQIKVHFIGALEGDQKLYLDIINIVKNLGYQTVTNHSTVRKISDVENETFPESKSYSTKMINWIKKADVVLVETTVSNFGAGYEIATALKLGRPVIVIYQNLGKNIPFVLMGQEDERLILSEYTVKNLKTILLKLLKEAEKYTSERFTLILPSPIIKHLDDVAEKGTTRSEYIRRLIARDIENI